MPLIILAMEQPFESSTYSLFMYLEIPSADSHSALFLIVCRLTLE